MNRARRGSDLPGRLWPKAGVLDFRGVSAIECQDGIKPSWPTNSVVRGRGPPARWILGVTWSNETVWVGLRRADYVPKPSWQNALGTEGLKRVVADIAYDADPGLRRSIIYNGGSAGSGGTGSIAPICWAVGVSDRRQRDQRGLQQRQ